MVGVKEDIFDTEGRIILYIIHYPIRTITQKDTYQFLMYCQISFSKFYEDFTPVDTVYNHIAECIGAGGDFSISSVSEAKVRILFDGVRQTYVGSIEKRSERYYFRYLQSVLETPGFL